jgi:hypothetical protein
MITSLTLGFVFSIASSQLYSPGPADCLTGGRFLGSPKAKDFPILPKPLSS